MLDGQEGASEQDVAFWISRRDLKDGRSSTGKRIFGEELEDGVVYDPPVKARFKLYAVLRRRNGHLGR